MAPDSLAAEIRQVILRRGSEFQGDLPKVAAGP